MNKKSIKFSLNGNKVSSNGTDTILQVAKKHGIEIPHLCSSQRYGSDGNCRTCMVEVEGMRVLSPSCCSYPHEGAVINTDSKRAVHSQKTVLELLKSDVTDDSYTNNSELDYWLNKLDINKVRFSRQPQTRKDQTHPAISVNFDACINCTRCLRACRINQGNDVIGMSLRGAKSTIVFDFDDDMGVSSCVACGECIEACPTGAIMPANNVELVSIDKKVNSICPYCGVGCQLQYHIKDNKIIYVKGINGPANQGRLCVKGRFGFDYINHKHRLTKPLIRKKGVSKSNQIAYDPNQIEQYFEEVSWDEALQVAADGFKNILKKNSPEALAGFGSAKCSNEEAYLFQKLIRTGFKTNNVDHCTRLCHASSVAALLECLGSGSVTNPVSDVKYSEVIVLTGSNPTVNHPVAATWIKNAVANGSKLIVMDPRSTELSKKASYHLQFNPGTDVAMLNAIMHTIVTENLIDQDFINSRTQGFAQLKQHLQEYSPELMAPICGIDAETLKQVARLYAKAQAAMILWGMGISQHIHGTNNARCLISMALMCGQIGKKGSGLHPLRGQNNVQGASDMGLIPMVLPDYKKIIQQENVRFFEQLWGCELDPKPGLTVVEIINKIYNQRIKGLFVMGENPVMSDPDSNHTSAALAKLEHLVVQDIFFTETAAFADVILPASTHAEKTGTFTNTDRLVQISQQAVQPPEDVRQDIWIIQQLAQKFNLGWNYQSVADVFEEIRLAVPSMAGISWDYLQKFISAVNPRKTEDKDGEKIIFKDSFATENGLAKFVAAEIESPDEHPDKDYPLVLITGRILEHWHTGTMTRRTKILDKLEPIAVVAVNPQDLANNDIESGELIKLTTRRGQISAIANADSTLPLGSVFMAFCYYEAAANKLSNPALDPIAKIPEFKYCAVNIAKGGKQQKMFSNYGGGVT